MTKDGKGRALPTNRRKQDYPKVCWKRRNVRCLAYVRGGAAERLNKRSQEYDPIHPPDAITTNLRPDKQSVLVLHSL